MMLTPFIWQTVLKPLSGTNAKNGAITLPQSESIILTLILIPTTSEQYSASLRWELNTNVDIKGEKGFFGNPD